MGEGYMSAISCFCSVYSAVLRPQRQAAAGAEEFNKKWLKKVTFCLPTAGRRTHFFHPKFTQPGKGLIVQPCRPHGGLHECDFLFLFRLLSSFKAPEAGSRRS